MKQSASNSCGAFRKMSVVPFTSYAGFQLTTHILYLFCDIDFHQLILNVRTNYQAANNKVPCNKVPCHRNLCDANFSLNSFYAHGITKII